MGFQTYIFCSKCRKCRFRDPNFKMVFQTNIFCAKVPSKCRKCRFRDPNFKKFPGGMPSDPPTIVSSNVFKCCCHYRELREGDRRVGRQTHGQTNWNIKRLVYCTNDKRNTRFNVSSEGPSSERNGNLVFHILAVHQLLYILICISTLSTQHTTFIALDKFPGWQTDRQIFGGKILNCTTLTALFKNILGLSCLKKEDAAGNVDVIHFNLWWVSFVYRTIVEYQDIHCMLEHA